MLSYEGFSKRVTTLLRVPELHPVPPDADLYGELGFDSLKAFELIIVVEMLAGLDVPPPELREFWTLSDAYGHYQQYYSRDDG